MSERTGQAFIIPAIDVIDGKCVRLTQGDYTQKIIYRDDPVEVTRSFAGMGLQRLHVVDLDGAKAGSIVHLGLLEKIAAAVPQMRIDFGGGVQQISDVRNILEAGAAMVTIGSLAVKQPQLLEEWLIEFGPDKFFIAADVLNEQVRISGWHEDAQVNIFGFIGSLLRLSVTNIFCTDISKDGLLQGPSTELYRNILQRYPGISLTASGGISTVADVHAVKEAGCAGVIIGKAIYEGRISPAELRQLNS